jgi:hypothetical protein
LGQLELGRQEDLLWVFDVTSVHGPFLPAGRAKVIADVEVGIIRAVHGLVTTRAVGNSHVVTAAR